LIADMPKIAVIIVSFNHGKFLPDCFKYLVKANYPRDLWKIFLVDNGSDDALEIARNKLIDEKLGKTRDGQIKAEIIKPKINTGFTGGNNIAIERAMKEGYEFVYLLNPDTEVEKDFLLQAVATIESDPKIGAVQSLMLLAQNLEKINSWGNEVHFLGFSFAGGYQVDRESSYADEMIKLRDIPSASGAAVMFKTSALKVVGLFDNAIFAYHEDVDISLRLRLAGFRVVLAPESVIRHRYEFSRSIKKFYFMERNRFWVVFKTLRLPTLILLLPAWIAMELGLWFFAFVKGWWREKARACAYYFSFSILKTLLAERRKTQKLRVISDRKLVSTFASKILYQEIAHPLWEYFGNYLFAFYWFVVKHLIWW